MWILQVLPDSSLAVMFPLVGKTWGKQSSFGKVKVTGNNVMENELEYIELELRKGFLNLASL